jgi:riboflavin-specific deaminase-like protein
MSQPVETASESTEQAGLALERAWTIVLAAARLAETLAAEAQPLRFGVDERGELTRTPAGLPAILVWHPRHGWELTLPPDDSRHALIDLYLPMCSATAASPITVGHLGQSLDGFIATHAGESHYVTGDENLRHMHRMRALSDAIVVGAGTVAADDPQLTTRHVSGPSPLRVVFDPARRLGDHYRVFRDDAADTIYVCARSQARPGESRFGRATLVPIDDVEGNVDAAGLVRLLHDRGCHRVFVEGGGVTVSMFLEANLLDRLQVAIAPLVIGDGRPAIRLTPPASLGDCLRPRYRVFRMGGDMLFDCDLRSVDADGRIALDTDGPRLQRVI